MNLKRCIGCRGNFPDIEGPTHRYMESSPGCWSCFETVLAREYGDLAYHEVHRLTVDTYAIQHPGQPSKQTINSVALHGISLCVIFDDDIPMESATRVIQQAAKNKARFEWLTPPASMGPITVADVLRAKDAETHVKLVNEWAQSAWNAWADHHDTFKQWLAESWD